MLERAAGRTAGFFYLVIIVAALFNEIAVRGPAFVKGDSAATAANILGAAQLWRFGAAADFAVLIADVAVAAIFYALLAPAGRALAFAAAAFRVAMTCVMAVNVGVHLRPLAILEGGAAALDQGAREQLAYLALREHAANYDVALVLFAAHCVLLGVLLWRARIVPRIFGLMFVAAGLAYAANSIASLVFPAQPFDLFTVMLATALPAEFGLTLWLLIFGAAPAIGRPRPLPARS